MHNEGTYSNSNGGCKSSRGKLSKLGGGEIDLGVYVYHNIYIWNRIFIYTVNINLHLICIGLLEIRESFIVNIPQIEIKTNTNWDQFLVF